MRAPTKFSLSQLVKFSKRPKTSEDCLFLNVYTPDFEPEKLKPVMVWIHGGGNLYGSGHDFYINGAHFAAQDVVFVSFNYRLGLQGFFTHPALTEESPNKSSGNYGLLDQIEALNWVQRNIEKLGGDPQNVTVFGESAGGSAVGNLMSSPLSEGLFHKAIAQSGMGAHNYLSLSENVGTATQCDSRLHCHSSART